MTTKTFYVKIRGRVLGPFPPQRLMQMASQGQLSRVHQLSADGNDWHRADKYPELFNSKAESRAVEQSSNQQSSSHQASNQQPAENTSQPAVTADWHYGVDGSSDGPVSKSKIISMIKKEALAAEDLLWHSDMSEWQPIDSLPEFAAYLPQEVAINVGDSGNSRSSNRSGSASDLNGTARILKSQTSWVLFMCICMYITAGLLFLAFLFGVIKGGQLRSNYLIGQGVGSLLQMGVVIVAAIFLNRFAACANRFSRTKRVDDLNQAFEWLQRFWLLISIVLIIFIFLTVTLLIIVFSISGTGL